MTYMIGRRLDPLASAPTVPSGRPTPPLSRQGLRGGPDFLPIIEGAGPALSGADPLLPALSPFTIWVEPPAFAAQAARPPGGVVGYGEGLRFVGQATNRQARRAAAPEYLSSAPPTKVGPQRTDQDLAAPQIADRDAALSIKEQLGSMREIPPLVLLVNPESVSVGRSKIAALSDRSRYGFIYQPWGDDVSKISISARCGGFYSAGRGLHVKSRDESAAWQSMMSLLLIYKNNACVQDPGGSYSPLMVGRVGVRYDSWIYRGHMDSLSWTEEENAPHGGLLFQVEMTATSTRDEAPYPLTVLPLRGPNTSPPSFAPAPAGVSPLQGFGGGPPPPTPVVERARASADPEPFLR